MFYNYVSTYQNNTQNNLHNPLISSPLFVGKDVRVFRKLCITFYFISIINNSKEKKATQTS